MSHDLRQLDPDGNRTETQWLRALLASFGKAGIAAFAMLAIGVPLAIAVWSRTEPAGEASLDAPERVGEDVSGERSWLRNDGRARASQSLRMLRSNAPSPKSRDPRTFTVFGVVRDPDGRPVARATVRGEREATQTGSDGSYSLQAKVGRSSAEIAAVRAWGKALAVRQYWVRAEFPGLAAAVQELGHLIGGEQLRVDLVLGPSLTVRGRVSDRAGQPIAGAWVKAHRRGQRSTRTADDGTFEVTGLDARASAHVLSVFAPGYVTSSRTVRASQDELSAGVDFVLSRGARVYGRVVDRDGEPVRGVFVTIGSGAELVRARSADDGRYSLPGVAAGWRSLNLRHPRFAVLSRNVEVPEEGQDLRVDIELVPGRRVTGRVFGSHGDVLANAEVVAAIDNGVVVRSTKTDSTGSFELERLPNSRLVIGCDAPGFLPLGKPIGPSWAGQLTLTLERAGRVGAMVVDVATGAAIQSFEVRVIEPSGSPHPSFSVAARVYRTRDGWTTIASAEGRWLSRELPNGFEGDVEFRAAGYAPVRLHGVKATADATPYDHRIELTPGVRLIGTVLWPGGAPLANALVRVVPNDEPVPVRPGITQIRAGSDGRFVVDDLGPGPHRLSVEHPDWGLFVHELRIPDGVRRWKEFVQLRQQAKILGVARSADGRRRPGVVVELSGLDVPGVGRKSWRTRSGASGEFEFSHVPFGFYRVSVVEAVHGKELETFATFVALRAGRATAERELGPAGSARIVGRLEIPPSAGTGPVVVRLSPRAAAPGAFQRIGPRVAAVEGGRFEFPGVEPGRYKVYAELVSGGQIRFVGVVEVDVGDRATARADIELQQVRRSGDK